MTALDRTVFSEITTKYLANETLRFLRDHDFGNVFDHDQIDPLEGFLRRSGDPDFEFTDSELEALRIQLRDAVQHFYDVMAKCIFPRGDSLRCCGIEKSWEQTRPKDLEKAKKDMNAASTAIVVIASELVRRGRRKLGP